MAIEGHNDAPPLSLRSKYAKGGSCSQQVLSSNYDTLMTVDTKTRPPSMCSGKKITWPSVQKKKMPLQKYPVKYAAKR